LLLRFIGKKESVALDANGNSPYLHFNDQPYRCAVCGYFDKKHLCKTCRTDPRLADPNNPNKVHPAVLALQLMADKEAARDRDENRQQRDNDDPARLEKRRQQKRDSARRRRAAGRAA